MEGVDPGHESDRELSPAARLVITNLITSDGCYSVDSCCSNGEEALAALKKVTPERLVPLHEIPSVLLGWSGAHS